jgi:hypothetical protein
LETGDTSDAKDADVATEEETSDSDAKGDDLETGDTSDAKDADVATEEETSDSDAKGDDLETGDTSDAKEADVATGGETSAADVDTQVATNMTNMGNVNNNVRADYDDASVTTEEKDAGTQSSSSDESDKNNEVSPSGNLSKLEKYPRFKLTC